MLKSRVESSRNVDDLVEFLNLPINEKKDIKSCDVGKVIVKYVVEEYIIPLDQCCTARGYMRESNNLPFLDVNGYKTFSQFGSKRIIVRKKKKQTMFSSVSSLILISASIFYISSKTRKFEGKEEFVDDD